MTVNIKVVTLKEILIGKRSPISKFYYSIKVVRGNTRWRQHMGHTYGPKARQSQKATPYMLIDKERA